MLRKALILTCLFVTGCAGRLAMSPNGASYVPIAESREYRYTGGSHCDDHRNLQWRMEQIETKIDKLIERTQQR